jgi:hypothetical protein
MTGPEYLLAAIIWAAVRARLDRQRRPPDGAERA